MAVRDPQAIEKAQQRWNELAKERDQWTWVYGTGSPGYENILSQKRPPENLPARVHFPGPSHALCDGARGYVAQLWGGHRY
jgi:hypothetical protein